LRTRYLEALREKAVLLWLDNVTCPAQVEKLIPPATCLLVVASRSQLALDDGVQASPLPAMTPHEAKTFLVRRVKGRQREIKKHAAQIAERCDYLPLALRVIGDLIEARHDIPIAITRRRSGRSCWLDRLDKWATRHDEFGRIHNSFRLSYDYLEPDDQKRWCMLSVFPSTFDFPALAKVWALGEADVDKHVDRLLRLIMVATEEGRYRMHNMARDIAREWLGDHDVDPVELNHRHASHYLDELELLDKEFEKGGDSQLRALEDFELDRANIEAGQRWAAQHADQDDRAATLCSQYPDVGVHVLSRRLDLDDQIAWFEVARAAAGRLEDEWSVGYRLHSLGGLYLQQRAFDDAEECCRSAIEIAKNTGNRKAYGRRVGTLGAVLSEAGDIEAGRELLETGLEYSTKHEDVRGQIARRRNLAELCPPADTKSADEHLNHALALARQLDDRWIEAEVLRRLGLARREHGDSKAARHNAQLALEIAEQVQHEHLRRALCGDLEVLDVEESTDQAACDQPPPAGEAGGPAPESKAILIAREIEKTMRAQAGFGPLSAVSLGDIAAEAGGDRADCLEAVEIARGRKAIRGQFLDPERTPVPTASFGDLVGDSAPGSDAWRDAVDGYSLC